MKVLQRSDQRRRMMLIGLARAEMLKGDYQRLLRSMGYDGSKKQFDPTRFKPPTDNTHAYTEKWVQVALNVILGLKMTVDGVTGPITRQAIKRFQRTEGLTAHGYIDDQTLQVLELRTGVQAPRQSGHEGVPSLLRWNRRGIWRPKDQQDRGGAKTKGEGKDGPEHDAAALSPDGVDSERDGEAEVGGKSRSARKVKPAVAGILQTEAMHSVVAVAFDDAFVAEAALELGRPGKAVRSDVDAWMNDQQQAENTPDWLQRAQDLARAHQELAASIVRQQWWATQEAE